MSAAAASVARIGHGAGTAGIMDALDVIERFFSLKLRFVF
jgi:hypothetical protein